MSREDALVRIAAAILANPSINSLNANAADVAMQARRVVDYILKTETAPSPAPSVFPTPQRPQDGEWLVRAATKRACVAWFVAYGLEHGFPSRMQYWSPVMVAQAVAARHNAAVVNGVMP